MMLKKNKLRLKKIILILVCVLNAAVISSQTFTDSNLPIVIITTDNGAEIPDEPKILGTMKIIQRPNGDRNYVTMTSS
jgi:hypothetical protein